MNSIKTILPLLFILQFTGCRQFFGDGNQPELIVQPPAEVANITITSPVHGSIWEQDDIIEIKWIAPGIKRIKIELFRKSSYKLTLAMNAENKGIYKWTIPGDLPLSNHYLLKISDQNDSTVYEFSGKFAVQ
jgi:hypothetical protein